MITTPFGRKKKYFWISANPSIWKVESIDDGGEIFYTACNQKGNKRRIFGVFEKAAPGEKVLFYESQPVQAIIADGLHAGGRGGIRRAGRRNNDQMQSTGVFRGLISTVSELDSPFNIFHASLEHDFTELTKPGSGAYRVVEATM